MALVASVGVAAFLGDAYPPTPIISSRPTYRVRAQCASKGQVPSLAWEKVIAGFYSLCDQKPKEGVREWVLRV